MEGVTFLRHLLDVIVFVAAKVMLVLGVLGFEVMHKTTKQKHNSTQTQHKTT